MRQIAQLGKRSRESRPQLGHLRGELRVVGDASLQHAQLKLEQNQLLLRAVVQVALDAATLGICRRDDPRPRGAQFFNQLDVVLAQRLPLAQTGDHLVEAARKLSQLVIGQDGDLGCQIAAGNAAVGRDQVVDRTEQRHRRDRQEDDPEDREEDWRHDDDQREPPHPIIAHQGHGPTDQAHTDAGHDQPQHQLLGQTDPGTADRSIRGQVARELPQHRSHRELAGEDDRPDRRDDDDLGDAKQE